MEVKFVLYIKLVSKNIPDHNLIPNLLVIKKFHTYLDRV